MKLLVDTHILVWAADHPRRLSKAAVYRNLLENGYTELPVHSDHAIALQGLPAIHKDPFDRMLIAQATMEGMTLMTVDAKIAKYPGPIRKV